MSSSPARLSKPVCWECEEAVDETIEIAVQLPSAEIATFAFCGPCYRSAYLPFADQAPVVRQPDPAKPSLLVVDDDPGIRGLLALFFRGEGFYVETATNGLEALQKARAQRPDAIVLDLWMPVMSGQEFLHRWRQTRSEQAIPVLAMSAYDVTATAEELGVRAFLPKPFSMDALLSAVDGLVGPYAVK